MMLIPNIIIHIPGRRRNEATTETILRHMKPCVITVLLLFSFVNYSRAYNDDNTNDDRGIFSSSRKKKWLYSSTAMAIEYHGCAWTYADNTDDAGCLEADSEDGLTSWYLMSNCRRTQAVYSVYSVEDSTSISCSKNTYVGTFVTKLGMYGFIKYLYGYDEFPIITGDDDSIDEDNFPMCEQDDNGYYLSVGCSTSSELTLDRFSDAYCLQYLDTYSTLDSISSTLSSYSSCHQTYSYANGNSPEYSMIGYLQDYSESCNQLDSPICYDVDGSKSKSLTGFNGVFQNVKSYTGVTFASKMKYALGTVFLVSSFIMFIGILVTNRRKRRAMLQRHFKRKSMADKSRQRSKSRGGGKGRSSSRGDSGVRDQSRGRRSRSRGGRRGETDEGDQEGRKGEYA